MDEAPRIKRARGTEDTAVQTEPASDGREPYPWEN